MVLFLNSYGVIALPPVCVWLENFQFWGHYALCLQGRHFSFFKLNVSSICLFHSLKVPIMTVDVCPFHNVTLVKMGIFKFPNFPSGFSALPSDGELTGPIKLFSLLSWYKSTLRAVCLQPTPPLQQQNYYVFHAFVTFLFSLPFSLTGQFRKGSPVRVFRWWWGSVSARFLLLGKIHT